MPSSDPKPAAAPDPKDAIAERAETQAKQPEKSHMHSKDAATPKPDAETPKT